MSRSRQATSLKRSPPKPPDTRLRRLESCARRRSSAPCLLPLRCGIGLPGRVFEHADTTQRHNARCDGANVVRLSLARRKTARSPTGCSAGPARRSCVGDQVIGGNPALLCRAMAAGGQVLLGMFERAYRRWIGRRPSRAASRGPWVAGCTGACAELRAASVTCRRSTGDAAWFAVARLRSMAGLALAASGAPGRYTARAGSSTGKGR